VGPLYFLFSGNQRGYEKFPVVQGTCDRAEEFSFSLIEYWRVFKGLSFRITEYFDMFHGVPPDCYLMIP
jgi:hypothetical protein